MVWAGGQRRTLRALKDKHNSSLWLWPPLCRRRYLLDNTDNTYLITLDNTVNMEIPKSRLHTLESWAAGWMTRPTDGCCLHDAAMLETQPAGASYGVLTGHAVDGNRSFSVPWGLKERHKPKNCVACFQCAKIPSLSCSCGFRTCFWNKKNSRQVS